ncbi:hypothetical protein, partial [Ralstonia sp. UBA689]|uniref:hypothetical protein n=1 Tax=Ralstonia sp. UBA689 TaxID=1947373 RepID=UPI0025EE02BD
MTHPSTTPPPVSQDYPPLGHTISGFSPFPVYESFPPLDAQGTQSLLRLSDATEIVARGIGAALRLAADNDTESALNNL